MRKYHHIGIPTEVPRAGESYLPEFKTFHSGFETSPYGIAQQITRGIANLSGWCA